MSKKHIVCGLIAHVDAGKTSLAEGILYRAGAIRNAGRVDHKDSFLDTDALERERGITIFSEQAELEFDNVGITLLDTPGHVDFSPETERVLPVLDACVLVISAADGVQSHTYTLWELLKKHNVPTFIFVNKMDQPGANRTGIMAELKSELGSGCVDFADENMHEEIASTDEDAISEFFENEILSDETVKNLILSRNVFPVYFGSALKMEGIDGLMHGICKYIPCSDGYSADDDSLSARVFKIKRDKNGNRETHLKVTGGTLRPKMLINGEKINELRIYSGASYTSAQEANPGCVCAVTGPLNINAGTGIGREKDAFAGMMEPVIRYQIVFPDGCDMQSAFRQMKQLEDEEPTLRISWNPKNGTIEVGVMGEIQLETLQKVIKNRFGYDVTFEQGGIVYKETINGVVEGIGHYEPLRHYAEVHLLLEPLPAGSGIMIASNCREDVLDRNWQRLILTHLAEKKFRGVLTDSEITDIKITLVSGKAHEKHTEGGDFRQATYRAVRQGLMSANSVLLEGVYDFRLEVPRENIGRVMTDLSAMHGEHKMKETAGDTVIFTGTVPVSEANGYALTLASFTGGRGKLYLAPGGFKRCHNEKEVIENTGYDPANDIDDPSSSVFCAHGAGFEVKWYDVPEHMHLPSYLEQMRKNEMAGKKAKTVSSTINAPYKENMSVSSINKKSRDFGAEDRELKAIFEKTYGAPKGKVRPGRDVFDRPHEHTGSTDKWSKQKKQQQDLPKYLLIDGYNIVFAWDELKELADTSLDIARAALMDIMSNYKGFHDTEVIIVFDAYRVRGNQGDVEKYKNITVVYTKEAQTADQYIEKAVNDLKHTAKVFVATSDGAEQMIIFGEGAMRITAPELKSEVDSTNTKIREFCRESRKGRHFLGEHLPDVEK